MVVIDRRSIQRQLLEAPNDLNLWSQFTRLLLDESRAPSEPLPHVANPALPVIQPVPADQGLPTESLLNSKRKIHLRFHQVGSEEANTVRSQQLDEFHSLLESGQYEAVLQRLGADLVEPLASILHPSTAYRSGYWAYEQERFDLAVPLFKAVLDAEDQVCELLPWAQLFLALSYRGLAEIQQARTLLNDLSTQLSAHDTGFHAQTALAWLDLNAGSVDAADRALDQLRQHSLASTQLQELDLIGRVLSTLDWLRSNQRDQLSHAVDRAASDGIVAAIDQIYLSKCGQVLQIHGWLVDPSHQLRELCLVRGLHVWRLNLGQARYNARPDLADVVARCGGDANLHPGFTLTQIALADEALPLRSGEAAELFAVLTNGSQFCLRRTLQGVELSTNQIKDAIDVAIQEPCHLASANLLHRARELWSAALQSKLQRAAEHRLFGAPPTQPLLSVIIPLYGRIDFMEYQLNWFNAWQRRKGRERIQLQLIYVLDDPTLKRECLSLAKRCRTLYSVPFELVINPENLGFAGANNRGSTFAQAPLLLFLNSDVLPKDDDSIEIMLSAMNQYTGQIGALGARLFFDNGAIQHQEMSFKQEPDLDGDLGRVWLNEHPLKGVKLPFDQDASIDLVEAEAATAACLMVELETYRHLGGFSSRYIIGDFEDSDLCLMLRSHGLPVLIDSIATFYHLERQSVNLASSNQGIRTKLVVANALTHHQRWCSLIERIKLTKKEHVR